MYNPFFGGFSAYQGQGFSQVFGGNMQLFGIERHFFVFFVGTFIKYYKISQLIHTQSIAN